LRNYMFLPCQIFYQIIRSSKKTANKFIIRNKFYTYIRTGKKM